MSHPAIETWFPFRVAVVSEKSPFSKLVLVNRDAPPVFVEAVASAPLGAVCVDVPEALLLLNSSKFELPEALLDAKTLIADVPVACVVLSWLKFDEPAALLEFKSVIDDVPDPSDRATWSNPDVPIAVELFSNLMADVPDAADRGGVLNLDVPVATALLAIMISAVIFSACDRFGVENTDVPLADVKGLRIILFVPKPFETLRIYEKMPIPSMVTGTISSLFFPDRIY